MERIASLPSDLKIETLIKLPYKTLVKRCKLLPELCNSRRFWLRKTAWDLYRSPEDPELVEIFNLHDYTTELLPFQITPEERYIRTLLYFGTVLDESIEFTTYDYMSKIAMYADDLEAFKKYLEKTLRPERSKLGNLCFLLNKIPYLKLIVISFVGSPYKYRPRQPWMLKLYLSGEQDFVKKYSKESDFIVIQELANIIKNPETTDSSNMFKLQYAKLLIGYIAMYNSMEAASKFATKNINPNHREYFLALCSILTGNSVASYPVRWEEFYGEAELLETLVSLKDLDAFTIILKYLEKLGLGNNFIDLVINICQSDNPIFTYIKDNYPNITLYNGDFTILQDYFTWTFIVEHLDRKVLGRLYNRFFNIMEENNQIILRELKKRSII